MPSGPRRTPSGNLIQDLKPNAKNTYQRIDAQSNAWRPAENESPLLDPQHPFAKPSGPSAQWGDAYTNLYANGPMRDEAPSFPSPHPYGNASNLPPPVSSSPFRPNHASATAPNYIPPGGSSSPSKANGNQRSPTSQQPFPSPHPPGPQPPVSARSVQTTGSHGTDSGTSYYATPAATPGDYRGSEQPWPDSRPDGGQRQRPESGIGLPGNPRLY